MLIYNSAKQFIGIDEHDLKTLGFSNLSQLRSEAADFADLFVRVPGHVHNFAHVHWIDFVSFAESAEESKVIISVQSKSYTASLSITKAYLSDNPSSEAYLISLNHLRGLSDKESNRISSELTNKPTPVAAIDDAQYKEMIPSQPIIKDAFDEEDVPVQTTQAVAFVEEPYAISDTPLDIDFEEEEIADAPVEFPEAKPEPVFQKSVAPVKVQRESVKKVEEIDDDDGYVFDPNVASDELGLPIDLIEEFIQDFIAQAHEFQAEMYNSLEENNINNVATLSHKLKGVAANLRIENALSAITIVNRSKDPVIIKTNLDKFYRIMRKLAGGVTKGEEVAVAQSVAPVPTKEDFVLDFKDEKTVVEKPDTKSEIKDAVEDDFVLDFKEDAPTEDAVVTKRMDLLETQEENPFATDVEIEEETPIKNTTVPNKIDVPELAEENSFATDVEIEEEPVNASQFVEVSYSKELTAKAIGLDMETFEELFGDYIKDSRNISSHIHHALAQDDFTKCAKGAHTLKGMSDSMHVKDFNSELECLMNSSDKYEMMDAIKKIDNVIEKISR